MLKEKTPKLLCLKILFWKCRPICSSSDLCIGGDINFIPILVFWIHMLGTLAPKGLNKEFGIRPFLIEFTSQQQNPFYGERRSWSETNCLTWKFDLAWFNGLRVTHTSVLCVWCVFVPFRGCFYLSIYLIIFETSTMGCGCLFFIPFFAFFPIHFFYSFNGWRAQLDQYVSLQH